MANRRAKNLNEYLKIVADVRETVDFLFRGQREDLPLQPKIARLKFECKRVVAESNMLNDLKRQSHPYLEFRPESEWDWIAIAQHHGLPTRLLDWSNNPLAALWFAVSNPPGKGDGVVWILNTTGLDHVDPWDLSNPLSLERVVVFQPRHLARRIGAQGGVFTGHPYQTETDSFLILNHDEQFAIRLTKIIIPSSEFSDIRWDLDACGINSACIFPDLDGLCRHIEWAYSLAPDEKDINI